MLSASITIYDEHRYLRVHHSASVLSSLRATLKARYSIALTSVTNPAKHV